MALPADKSGMKHFFSLLLAAMAILAGIAGNVSSGHWKAAIFFWSLCGVLAVLAAFIGFIETIPKPHLVPIGYGREDGTVDGLVFFNDGEPAYRVTAPEPTPIGGPGDAKLFFNDPKITRLSMLGGKQIFPITVNDSLGPAKINDLRNQMVLHGVHSVLVSFDYADGRRPTLLRYTTTCKIERTTEGISISLEKWEFRWWKLF